MFTELGKVIASAIEQAAEATIDAADEHSQDSPCVPFGVVMNIIHQIEGQAKTTERHVYEAIGGGCKGDDKNTEPAGQHHRRKCRTVSQATAGK